MSYRPFIPVQIETYNEGNRQSIIGDATGLSFSSHYGEGGSGFGFCKFVLGREVGNDYRDIGFGYRLIVRKYLGTILFDGQIRQIGEKAGAGGDEIEIGALGHLIVAEDDEFTRRICDTRASEWEMDSEVPTGSFQPGKFTVNSGATGIVIYSSNNQVLSAGDYTQVVYDFESDENGERLKCNLSMVLGYGNLNGAGPNFSAEIASISGTVITYTNDTGENNLAADQILANITKKGTATISSNNTGADTITVSDADHIDKWETGDTVFVGAPYFEATFSSFAGTTLTYSGPTGEAEAAAATGWVVHNVDEDEYAEVASWNEGSDQFDVTNAGDITGNWTNGDTIRIYTPFALQVREEDGTMIWPASDWREGAIPRSWTAVNVTPSSASTKFIVRLTCYVAGSAGESTFANLNSLRVYSVTDETVTSQTLATEILSILSAAGHDLSSDTDDIEAISKTLEPAVFEYAAPSQVMSWVCKAGDGSGNLLAWGVRLTDGRKFFLETQDRSTIDYKVRRDVPVEASVSGDVQGSVQQVRIVYEDELGVRQHTDWLSDEDAYFAGHFRRQSVKVDNINTADEADELAALFLSESKQAKRQANYTVSEGAVFTPADLIVPIDEVKATGRMVTIEDWRSVETGGSTTDIRDSWTQENIVVVQIDYENRTAQLTPAGAKDTFTRYIAELSRIRSGL
jgi:hypothetical protein